jgi:hypothetical protein
LGSAGSGGKGDAGGASGSGGAAPTSGKRLGVNDVSYLFPLPKSTAEQNLLASLSASGPQGALLSETLFSNFDDIHAPEAGMYASSRVVSLRLDPCAGQTVVTAPATCQPQVRLVAEPISGTFAEDAAVHLSYNVSRSELDAIVDELLALKASSSIDVSTRPLGPHPIMVEQGLAGPFAQGVVGIITKHLGEANLAKFTGFFVGIEEGNDWEFEQFVKTNGKFASPPIVLNDAVPGVEFFAEAATDGRQTSINQTSAYPSALLNSASVKGMPQATVIAALTRLAEIEDPAKESVTTVDCATCHLGINARSFYETFTGLSAALSFVAPAGQNISRVDQTQASGRALHAFSYHADQAEVAQRTINESARVADWLSGNGP